MILDAASEWRKGRDGYARKRLLSLREAAYRQMRDEDINEIAARRKARGRRHGRAGALYCGGDK